MKNRSNSLAPRRLMYYQTVPYHMTERQHRCCSNGVLQWSWSNAQPSSAEASYAYVLSRDRVMQFTERYLQRSAVHVCCHESHGRHVSRAYRWAARRESAIRSIQGRHSCVTALLLRSLPLPSE